MQGCRSTAAVLVEFRRLTTCARTPKGPQGLAPILSAVGVHEQKVPRNVCRQVGKWYDHFQFWPCHLKTVADLKKDRSCLKKDNQAKSGALSIPGNAGGSRLDARSVTAVLKSLDGVSISNRPAEVNGAFEQKTSYFFKCLWRQTTEAVELRRHGVLLSCLRQTGS